MALSAGFWITGTPMARGEPRHPPLCIGRCRYWRVLVVGSLVLSVLPLVSSEILPGSEVGQGSAFTVILGHWPIREGAL
jgi:hypothetical protein